MIRSIKLTLPTKHQPISQVQLTLDATTVCCHSINSSADQSVSWRTDQTMKSSIHQIIDQSINRSSNSFVNQSSQSLNKHAKQRLDHPSKYRPINQSIKQSIGKITSWQTNQTTKSINQPKHRPRNHQSINQWTLNWTELNGKFDKSVSIVWSAIRINFVRALSLTSSTYFFFEGQTSWPN